MAQRSGFFDASAGDRQYDSAFLAALLQALVQRDGVVYGYGDALQVAATAPASMAVQVKTGAAFPQGRLFEVYTAPETMAIATANPTNPRIDRVVVRLDLSTGIRSVALAVLTGVAQASPVAPSLTRNSSTWELSLAQVAVGAGVASIVSGNITDERGDPSLCDVVRLDCQPGDIKLSGQAYAPLGMMECDGRAVSRTKYARLFAAIGTNFGPGDGSTTFNIPDMRGEFPRGWDHGRGVDIGRVIGSAQADEIKQHNHGGLQAYVNIGASGTAISTLYTGSGVNVANTGGVETRPRNVALMFFIRY